MVGLATLCRYFARRCKFSADMVYWMNYNQQITESLNIGVFATYLFSSRMTYLYFNKEGDKNGMLGGTLLVRKTPDPDERTIRVNDVVIITQPGTIDSRIVRRVVAVRGCVLESTDPREYSITLYGPECWITTDNREVKDTEDSRTFGPADMTHILGRVIYCFRSSNDHMPVKNSTTSAEDDAPVLEVELDIDEMEKYHTEKKMKFPQKL